MPYNKHFKRKTDWFIETGTFYGDGVQLALDSGFDRVFSIEIYEELCNLSKDRFKSNDKVEILLGDSSVVLKDILDSYPETRFTYWLDGHYSGEGTGRGQSDSPLLIELEHILSRKKSNEIIYIDDMRIYRNFDNHLNTKAIYDICKKYIPHGHIHYEPSYYDTEDILVIEY